MSSNTPLILERKDQDDSGILQSVIPHMADQSHAMPLRLGPAHSRLIVTGELTLEHLSRMRFRLIEFHFPGGSKRTR